MADITSPTTAEDTPSRFRIRWWMWPLFLIVLLLLAWIGWQLALTARINAELQAIRDAGYPATSAELNDWYPQPQGPNAAEVYQDAFDLMVEPDENDEALLPIIGTDERQLDPTQPLPDDVLVAIDRYLTVNQRTRQLLHQAATIKDARYPLDYTEGFDALFPHLSPIRDAAGLLMIEAIHHANQDNLDATVDSLATAAGLGHSLELEPNLIAALVQNAVYALIHGTVEDLLQRHDFSNDQLARLSQIVRTTWSEHAIERASLGEQAVLVDLMRNEAASLVDLTGELSPWMRAYVASGMVKRDTLFYLQAMQQFITAAQAPPDRQVELALDASARFDHVPSTLPVARMILPAIGRVIVIHHRTRFTREQTLIALALLRYRHATGRFPEQLQAVAPKYLDAVPINTFTGEPIHYVQPTPESFILFGRDTDHPDQLPAPDPERWQFIHDLQNYLKFEYRVPADHPSQLQPQPLPPRE